MLLKNLVLSLTIVGATLTGGASAQAQSRTWVSGVGDDVNPCSRTAPCKTFAGAISKTAAGGEINCLDPGGFGAVTITKSITIDCHEVFGSVLVSGTNGININSDNAAAPVVRLRNLNVTGITGLGLNGIRITGATTSNAQVFIEDCLVDGFNTRGITDERTGGGHLYITNTTVRNSVVNVAVTSSAISASLNNVRSFHGTTSALTVNTGATAMIANSVFSGSGIGLDVESGGVVVVDNSSIDHNSNIGIFNSASTVRVSNSNIAFNATAINGTASSFTNNQLSNNGAGAPTPIGSPTSPTGQQ